MATPQNIIVWVWEDERLTWRPYEPHVSNFIEQSKTPIGLPLNLGKVDRKLAHYVIDFANNCQIRTNTGKNNNFFRSKRLSLLLFNRFTRLTSNIYSLFSGVQRRIERHIYPPTSPLFKNFVWQFEGDGKTIKIHPKIS